MTVSREIVYGTSRYRWGHAAWIAWPLSSDGRHWTDSLRPFRWMAVRRARRMARKACVYGVRAASEVEVAVFEWDLRKGGSLDVQPFGKAFRPWG